jgi:UDP-GlcNAc:undecaprenyl-phosphate/decaprenyl-phosphate GlcNAc-1-phosphate transferase
MGAGVELILHPDSSFAVGGFGYLLLAATPAFIGGLLEDITKNVGVAQRLLFTMISAAIGTWLLGAVINRLDIPLLDNAMHWLPFAIVFTVFAVGGVANSINILDGYNGLAAGFSIIVLIALAAVAAQVNDNLVLMVSVSMIGTMLGFLAWNWPKGKIFMGDGGAYLLGFILAELSVLLVSRNPSVSPWFPLLLLAYPVFETLFSIYRRKLVRKSTPGHPDALHLHHLIFKRLVRGHINGGCHHQITRNNSRVAPYIWTTALLGSIFAVLFWQTTSILMMAAFSGCALYVFIYRQLTTLRLRGLIKWARRRK